LRGLTCTYTNAHKKRGPKSKRKRDTSSQTTNGAPQRKRMRKNTKRETNKEVIILSPKTYNTAPTPTPQQPAMNIKLSEDKSIANKQPRYSNPSVKPQTEQIPTATATTSFPTVVTPNTITSENLSPITIRATCDQQPFQSEKPTFLDTTAPTTSFVDDAFVDYYSDVGEDEACNEILSDASLSSLHSFEGDNGRMDYLEHFAEDVETPNSSILNYSLHDLKNEQQVFPNNMFSSLGLPTESLFVDECRFIG